MPNNNENAHANVHTETEHLLTKQGKLDLRTSVVQAKAYIHAERKLRKINREISKLRKSFVSTNPTTGVTEFAQRAHELQVERSVQLQTLKACAFTLRTATLLIG